MKFRRTRSLVGYWSEGEFVLEDYLTEKSSDVDEDNAVVVDEATLRLLDKFDDWTDVDAVAAELPDYSAESVREAVDTLVDAGLLRTPEMAEREDQLAVEWAHWSQEARFFHFGTKDAVYIGDDDEHRSAAAEVALASGPPPEIFKSYPDAPRVRLPRAFLPLRGEFGEVLLSRRTHRAFTPTPVGLRELATVLHYTFAPMYFVDAREYGTLFMRTSPGGGARQELEAYVGVLNVDGVTPGLYHYNVEQHSLELIDPDFAAADVDRLAFGQQMAVTSGFVVFMTALVQRAAYKYRHPRTLRMIMLDAGHLAQTFNLVCTAAGLGPFQTAAFRDTEVERALGIDGIAETALYLLGAGNPAGPVDGRPIDMTLAAQPV
ncbi:SagB-type dehydrogenase family enzyme [Herbihabitans rhizosphaerae]|uniref:SagB-type dehydrogenase family enzyme n=1 Tax=Herbihabitans rhizosphaerae TaxID=1872711 RepID=A0A4Q7L5X5_9PSEU|nr:SagB/ThcOx family dehydrogenase [Herbihabitans rhizosphaerae]RZS44737.1 SagB-type dehydrogenase family enzyme [Herbihabitans rhizosphaerae]